MKSVVYDSPFVPAEWIAAHKLRPKRILPCVPARKTPAGVCPYAWAFGQSVHDAYAAVFATTCDQMRRVNEIARRETNIPLFLMNVPSTWQTTQAQRLYVSELGRLGQFLQSIGGTEPSKEEIAACARKHDEKRSSLQNQTSVRRDTVPLALIGSPLLQDHLSIFNTIENAGGSVTLNGTTSGERTLPAPFDRRSLNDDPLAAIADAYFGTIPDAFRRPNSSLYEWTRKQILARDIKGVIFLSYTWCDIWHAEAQRMKEWLDIPLLFIEAVEETDVAQHTVSRIESFVEMLK